MHILAWRAALLVGVDGCSAREALVLLGRAVALRNLMDKHSSMKVYTWNLKKNFGLTLSKCNYLQTSAHYIP